MPKGWGPSRLQRNLGANAVGRPLDTGTGRKLLGHQLSFQEGCRKAISKWRLQGG